MAKKINLGTLYVNGEKIISPTKPWSTSTNATYKHPTGAAGNLLGNASINSIEIKETDSDDAYAIKWVDVYEDGSFLIADRILYKCTYNYINSNAELHDGKTIILDNKIYVLRLITEEEYMNYIVNDLNIPTIPTPSDLDRQEEWDSNKYYSESNEVWNWAGVGTIFKSFRRSSPIYINYIYKIKSNTDKDALPTNAGIRFTLKLISDNSENAMPSKLEKNSSLTEISDKVNNLCLGLELYKHRLATSLVLADVNILENDYKFSTLIDKTSERLENKFMLYDNGDECISVTGGWVNAKYSDYDGSSDGTVENKNGRLELKAKPNGWCASPNNLVDVTAYNSMHFIADTQINYSGGNVKFMCGSTKFSEFKISAEVFETSNVTKKHIILDISQVKGLNYIYFGAYLSHVNVYEVWLEK